MSRILLALALVFGIASTLTAADLSGMVVAEHDGTPVAAAAITLRSAGRVVAEIEADSSGLFRASGLPAAEYIVAATKASFTSAERRVTLTEAGADVLLQVAKLGVISGRVTDTQGNGIRNMAVAAVPVPADGGPLRVYNSRPKGAATDARGGYRIFGLPAGDYVVVALAGNGRSIANVPNGVAAADTSHGNTAEFYPSGRSPIVLPVRSGEEHTNINFTGYTGPLFTIRGTVAGPSPDTPYRVSLVAEAVGIPLASATAQPGKEFQFDRVAPGTYKIVATRQPSGINNLAELINSGQIVINSANEAALLESLRAAGVSVTATERGITLIEGGAPAQRAEPAFGETTVTVSQNVTGVTLSARPGVDAKLLYQAATGCPTSVQLALNPIEYMGAGNSGKKLDAGVESSVTGIPSGPYSVSLDLPESSGCYAVTSTIDFRQVSSGATVPIVVANMGHIQGKVDTTGHVAEDFTIALISPDGITKRTFALSKDSSFSIPNLRPGRYRLTVSRRSATRVVAADQNIIVESGATAQVEFPALP